MLAAAVVAGAAAMAGVGRVAPTYEAAARVLVGPVDGDRNVLDAASQQALTYAELALSRPVVELAVAELDFEGPSADELAAAIDAVGSSETRIVTITARHGDPVVAARAADGVAAALLERAAELPGGEPVTRPPATEAPTAEPAPEPPPPAAEPPAVEPAPEPPPPVTAAPVEPSPPLALTVVEPSEVPDEPVEPRPVLVVALAVTAAVALAFALAVWVDRSRRPVDADDVAAVTPVLGSVARPWWRPTSWSAVAVEQSRRSGPAAAYRLLAGRLGFLAGGRSVHRVLLVGAGHDAPAADVGANIALAAAEAGEAVVLVDATSAGSALRLLGLDPQQVASWGADADEGPGGGARGGDAGLRVVRADGPTGRRRDDAAARQRLDRLGHDVSVVVVADPAWSSTATLAWAAVCDQVLLTVRPGRTRHVELVEAATVLHAAGGPPTGAVLVSGIPVGRSRAGRAAPSETTRAEPATQPATAPASEPRAQAR